MKSRILKTDFWEDNKVLDLSATARYFYSYLLTNPKINMIGVYELPENLIMTHTSLSKEDINKSKQELTEKGRAIFSSQWVAIAKAITHSNYYRSPKCFPKVVEELENIPEDFRAMIINSLPVLDFQLNGLYTSIDTSIHTSTILHRNQKPEKRRGSGGNKTAPKISENRSGQNFTPTPQNPKETLTSWDVTDWNLASPQHREYIKNSITSGLFASRPDWFPPKNTPANLVKIFESLQNSTPSGGDFSA